MTDSIVEEVRRYRDRHARRFNYDLNLICEDLRNKHTQNIELLETIKATNKRVKSATKT
ncbi:MAG: hypothetical protein PF692_13335 [Kiritimatiellae bacterium]|jgi:hypothetical protein|nr:hypothetical protein [Kiritimatiellia bacterium]